jgi:hypothetical protein
MAASDDKPADAPQQCVCLDCWLHSQTGPEMAPDGTYCVHFTPEYWAERGYKRHWGDAAVMNWPHLEILRRETDDGGTEFVILAPHASRRPVILYGFGHAWGAY